MHKKHHKSQCLRRLLMEDNQSTKTPNVSTSTSEWIRGRDEPTGDLNLVHGFLGISLNVPRESLTNIKTTAVKFRVFNKPQCEPFLEGSDHRVYDIIQLHPKQFQFSPPAELTVRLPSCVHEKSAGQVVCMFSSTFTTRNDSRYLKWKRIDSQLFVINHSRTEAKITCNYSGFYTLILTQCPEATANLTPLQNVTIHLEDHPGIKITCEKKSVDSDTKVTIKIVCLEDLYNSPSASPTSCESHRRLPIQLRENPNDNMLDVTGSPVVLVRPFRTRFSKPVRLAMPLLGDEFEGFFNKESSRLVVLRSNAMEEESILWHHHYSTPEVEMTSDSKKVASFLITGGGLFKVVRRFPNKHMRFIEQISTRISRELCLATSPNIMAASLLKGLTTDIAEPGKQFALRICLLDSSQTENPDGCFRYSVCSQPLTIPLGRVRLLVRGRFEPDRDAADHSEERTVMFTGKTTFVDFNLKLRLSDPTKLPETIGKVTVYSTSDVQYYINLHKPKLIPKVAKSARDKPKSRGSSRMKARRHTTGSSMKIPRATDSFTESALSEYESRESSPFSSSFVTVSEKNFDNQDTVSIATESPKTNVAIATERPRTTSGTKRRENTMPENEESWNFISGGHTERGNSEASVGPEIQTLENTRREFLDYPETKSSSPESRDYLGESQQSLGSADIAVAMGSEEYARDWSSTDDVTSEEIYTPSSTGSDTIESSENESKSKETTTDSEGDDTGDPSVTFISRNARSDDDVMSRSGRSGGSIDKSGQSKTDESSRSDA